MPNRLDSLGWLICVLDLGVDNVICQTVPVKFNLSFQELLRLECHLDNDVDILESWPPRLSC